MIGLIDYGLGNIRAFLNVYKRLNMPCLIASKPKDLKQATRLVLPGVGAFDEAMDLLAKSGMREPLEEMVLGRKLPLLGVCVGMQMLAKSSEEGHSAGLGWIDGRVRKFDETKLVQKPRLPHMGWNQIVAKGSNPLLRELENESRFYFLHSYYFHCEAESEVIAETEYGAPFSSAVAAGNIFGVQFHPEKSHGNGVKLLKNFGQL
ncbi:MAG: imidazole glycerol phosphate synthase subunit HisH [Fibrobacteria bacterium]